MILLWLNDVVSNVAIASMMQYAIVAISSLGQSLLEKLQ